MSRPIELSRDVVLDEDYWLCRCDGFAVEAEGRRLGVVAELRYRSRHDRPDQLVVYGGVFGNRVLVVPIQDVEHVVPREQRVELTALPASLRPREPALRSRVASVAQRAAHALHA